MSTARGFGMGVTGHHTYYNWHRPTATAALVPVYVVAAAAAPLVEPPPIYGDSYYAERASTSYVFQDNPVGMGDGSFKGRRLFQTAMDHASLVPMLGLMKADDFDGGDVVMEKRGDEEASKGDRPEATAASASAASSPGPRTRDSPGRRRRQGWHRAKSKSPSPTPSRTPPPPSSSSPLPPPPPPSPPRFETAERPCAEADLELGTLVELRAKGEPAYGVVRWIGISDDGGDHKIAGIELEEEMLGAGTGCYKGSQLFSCADGKGVFVPLANLALDRRFGSAGATSDAAALAAAAPGIPGEEFGDIECPAVPGFHPPVKVSDAKDISGRNKGIQGHQNSCYLDATLFAMFSFTSVFDSLLYRPHTAADIPEYTDVQRVLREEIVNPLRKNFFVRADRVMKLRRLLDGLTSVRGLTSEEKDPEEFLNSLLTQALRSSPFLELSSGQTAHLYQLFVERDESIAALPTVQQLLEQSFLTSAVKLKRVPAVLVLQMPRFGRQFKVYERIVPSELLDITGIVEGSPRQCIICGKLATVECLQCYGDHDSGLDSTAFCEGCMGPVHNHQRRKDHRPSPLAVSREYLERGGGGESASSSLPRLYMELFAVVCIETSHYVSFVKCGLGPDAPWCFFDSMADRRGEAAGYNIPEVMAAPDVARWLAPEGRAALEACSDDKRLPAQAKRLICDGYMCFYQSPKVMMYQ